MHMVSDNLLYIMITLVFHSTGVTFCGENNAHDLGPVETGGIHERRSLLTLSQRHHEIAAALFFFFCIV
jgi:hypothetical protein